MKGAGGVWKKREKAIEALPSVWPSVLPFLLLDLEEGLLLCVYVFFFSVHFALLQNLKGRNGILPVA